jgi:two-component system, NarL family, sensor histidine kinase UhpB
MRTPASATVAGPRRGKLLRVPARTESRRRRYLPLLHRVAVINVLLLLVAVGLTIVILAPSHESSFRIDEEGVALLVAVILVVVLNLLLLRRVVRPVQRLTEVARTVDLIDPVPAIPDAEPSSEAGELALTFNDMLTRLRSERQEATGRVLAGQEAERLRIAQELHDQVGQELTAVLLLLSRVESRGPEEVRSAVAEAQDSVRASLEDVRRIAIELRPEALDDLGLESALVVLCDRLAQRSGLEVSCQAAEGLPELSTEAELVIHRVAQEALTNVARHSGSRRAELTLRREDGHVVLTVRDYGRGMQTNHEAGSGIRGMRERAALIGAAVEVLDATPGPGTAVRLEVPAEVDR